MSLTEQSMQDLAVRVLVLQELGVMPLGERVRACGSQVDTFLRRLLLGLAAALLPLWRLQLLFVVVILTLKCF